MASSFVLRVDFPSVPKGTVFTQKAAGDHYFSPDGKAWIAAERIENSPDRFQDNWAPADQDVLYVVDAVTGVVTTLKFDAKSGKVPNGAFRSLDVATKISGAIIQALKDAQQRVDDLLKRTDPIDAGGVPVDPGIV